MRLFSICAVGPQRSGLLASLATRLAAYDANVCESQMAILRGYTMLTLLVDAPDELDEVALGEELAIERNTHDLATLTLAELPDGALAKKLAPSHIVSFYGPDRHGMLADVASGLAERKIHVCELQSRQMINGDSDEPLQVMLLEVAPPDGANVHDLDKALRAVADGENVEIAVAPLD